MGVFYFFHSKRIMQDSYRMAMEFKHRTTHHHTLLSCATRVGPTMGRWVSYRLHLTMNDQGKNSIFVYFLTMDVNLLHVIKIQAMLKVTVSHSALNHLPFKPNLNLS